VFRERAAHLTSRIGAALPSLTVHDATHLDALWETADVIVGPAYPINPMEGFVLGGSFLLHDAALCFEAYSNGQQGLRDTLEWRDAFASESNKGFSLEEAQNSADFAAMRVLHARRAGELATAYWQNPEGDQLHLIENHELRKHYGAIIGTIAASHHWSIEDVRSKLPAQINAPGNYPREWRVDPVKLACILRCADAAHVDDRRAPDFLRALIHRQGLSANHWTAQNWLSRVDLDTSDPDQESLLYTSNHGFRRENTGAWWIAYDAICLIDKELRSSNAVLAARPQRQHSPPFATKRVSGADSPTSAAKHIEVDGWEPCTAQLHVGNVEALVRDLGGEQLYGDHQKFGVALREVIQNARDAVIARRAIEQGYTGAITVSLEKNGELYSIVVEDDGVGMSERVLTGPLLDFGNSFWASNLVREEFPGLSSSKFKPVGRYGIGFYATFMIASAVTVSSRRWDNGLDDVITLEFPEGLTLRPTMTRRKLDNFKSTISTRVILVLDDTIVDPKMVPVSYYASGEARSRPLKEALATIAAGIDVDVTYVELGSLPTIAHPAVSSLTTVPKRIKWLGGLRGSKTQNHGISQEVFLEHARRLRPIVVDDQIIGLAALSTLPDRHHGYLAVRTVGGLAGSLSGDRSDTFMGFIDQPPVSARREAYGTYLVPDILDNWAQEQLQLLRDANLSDQGWCAVTYSLADLGVDPLPVAHITVIEGLDSRICDMNALFNICKDPGLVIYQSMYLDHIESYHKEGQYKHYPTLVAGKNSRLLRLNEGGEEFKYSIISCIERFAAGKGHSLSIEVLERDIEASMGTMHALLVQVVPDS
jgi:hypothetical protein